MILLTVLRYLYFFMIDIKVYRDLNSLSTKEIDEII